MYASATLLKIVLVVTREFLEAAARVSAADHHGYRQRRFTGEDRP
jgi:hypothetical protein